MSNKIVFDVRHALALNPYGKHPRYSYDVAYQIRVAEAIERPYEGRHRKEAWWGDTQ
jgi:hypothetical protein